MIGSGASYAKKKEEPTCRPLSMRTELPYVHAYRSRKRWYTYYRRDKQQIRIRGHVVVVAGVIRASDEWMTNYGNVHASFEDPKLDRAPKEGTMADLISIYKSSPEYAGLGDKTKKDYGRYLNILQENYGMTRIEDYDMEAVIAIRDIYSETPTTANYMVRVVRLLFSFAEGKRRRLGLEAGWRNPARRPKVLNVGDGHRPWEENEIAAFRERWELGTLERTIFEMMTNTGQRGGDVARMERGHIGPDGTISVAQEKTKARVWIPQSQDLVRALKAWDRTQASRIAAWTAKGKSIPRDMKLMVLTGDRGRRISADYLRHTMIDAFQTIPGLISGLKNDGVTSHGLRYTAAVVLDELGCDWETIASITGHETVVMVKKYLEKKRRARLAVAALDAASLARNKN